MTKESGLVNWNPDKGNPFNYTSSEWRDIISEDTKWEISEPPHKFKSLKSVHVTPSLKLLASLDLKHAELLSGYDKTNGKSVVFLELGNYIDYKKPIIVWINYPFEKYVKVTIYPLVRTFKETNRTIILDHIGYVMWQIAQVYAEIYKDHWESVGIWGHGFEDLYLECLNFCEGNQIKILVGS